MAYEMHSKISLQEEIKSMLHKYAFEAFLLLNPSLQSFLKNISGGEDGIHQAMPCKNALW